MRWLVFAGALGAVAGVSGPALVLILLPLICLAFGAGFSQRPRAGLGFLLVSMGLPIYIQFQGRDALVLSTGLILVAYFVTLLQGKLAKLGHFGWPYLLLVIIYLAGTVKTLGLPVFASSVRMVSGIVAAFMLGHLVVSVVVSSREVITLVRALGLLLIIQGLVVVWQELSPNSAAVLFDVFAARGAQLGPRIAGGLSRPGGLIGSYELVGEWFAGGVPVMLGMVSIERKYSWFWMAAFLACVAGITLTLTRGAVIAAVSGVAVFLVLLALIRKGPVLRTTISVFVIGTAVLLTVIAIFPEAADNLVARLSAAESTYSSGSGLLETINRTNWKELPPEALRATAFGHGIYRLDTPIAWWGSPHSLPLSLWYQVGIVGCAAAACIALQYLWQYAKAMRVGAVERGQLHILGSAFFAGMIAMMVSELKVEVTRAASTSQFFAYMVALGLSIFFILRRQGAALPEHSREVINRETPPIQGSPATQTVRRAGSPQALAVILRDSEKGNP